MFDSRMRYLRGSITVLVVLVILLTPPVLTKPLESLHDADQLAGGITNSSTLHASVGYTQLPALEFEQARSALNRAFDAGPMLGIRDVSGLARLMQNETEELGEAPSDMAYVAAHIGHALLRMDEKRLARFYLEKAVELRPGYAEVLAYLGYIYWWEGRQDEALSSLREAIRNDPSLPVAHFLLGVVLRGPRQIDSKPSDRGEQRQLSEAIAEFREAIRLDGKNAEAYVELARTLTLEARYQEAADAYAAAMRLQPRDVELKLWAIWFHLDHLFRVERGLELAREAEQAEPSNAEVKDAFGWALYVNGHVDEAEGALRQAIEMNPFSARTRYHLAVLLQQRGDIVGTEEEYTRAIDLGWKGAGLRRGN